MKPETHVMTVTLSSSVIGNAPICALDALAALGVVVERYTVMYPADSSLNAPAVWAYGYGLGEVIRIVESMPPARRPHFVTLEMLVPTPLVKSVESILERFKAWPKSHSFDGEYAE